MLFFLQPLRFHPVEEPEPEPEDEDEEEVEAEFDADEVTEAEEPFDDHDVESEESFDEESSLAYAATGAFDDFAAEVEAEIEPEEEE